MATRAARTAADLGGDAIQRIESVAARLFIQHGYNGVSYLDIARELGITHSSVHYYYRTKGLLAEAVLRRVADATLGAMRSIWTGQETSLLDKFVATRDWIYAQYLLFNPDGKGGRPWGLLWRLSMDADALPAGMKRVLRSGVDRLEGFIAAGVESAVTARELSADAPREGITLQIDTVITASGQVTRHAAGFERFDELMRWTYAGFIRAYGPAGSRIKPWPALPALKEVRLDEVSAIGRR